MLGNQTNWMQKDREDFFFPVQEEPVEINGYKFPEKRKLYRERDDGGFGIPELISVVGNNYHIVENAFINKVVENTGLFELNETLSHAHKNRLFTMTYFPKNEYDIGENDDDGPENGKRLIPTLLVKNAYDGTAKLTVTFGIWRPLCRNMMIFEKQILETISMRHFEKNQIEKKIQQFVAGIMKNENVKKIKNKVIELKNQKEMNLTMEFFNQLPIRLLYPVLVSISKFTKNMEVSKDSPIYLLKINQIIKKSMEFRNYENINQDRIEYKINEYDKALNYNERVTNNWLFLNMLIKISHKFLKEHQRFNMSRLITNQF